MKTKTYCYLLLILSGSSCITPRSYFMSPMDINSNPYHTLPMALDSRKSATYANLALHAGGSNENLRDVVLGGRLSIHRGYQFGNMQAYYGGGLSVGNYHVQDTYLFRNYLYGGMNDTTYHLLSSNKFFGTYGFNGGMNFVIPFGNGRGEWRVIGFESSFQKEFGDYLPYRKHLPDSAANVLESYDHVFTIGGTTEIVAKTSKGIEIGYKLSLGSVFAPSGYYLRDQSDPHPYYFSHTVHITQKKVTGFMQFNFGLHAASFQFGVNYNLSKRPGL